MIDSSTFERNETWNSLISYCKSNNAFQDTNTVKEIQKEIQKSSAFIQLSAKSNLPVTLNNQPWSITFTKQAKSSIEKLSEQVKVKLIERVLHLASGKIKLSKSSQTERLNSCKIENSFVLLWSIELESCSLNYKQVIQIWDIMNSGKVAQISAHIKHVLQSRSDQYISACLEVDSGIEEGCSILKPVFFPKTLHTIPFYKTTKNQPAEVLQLESSADLTKLVKKYSFTHEIIGRLHDEVFKQMELPFILGEDEQALAESYLTSFILGRSGTGKTTVMLTKIISKEVVAAEAEIESYTDKPISQWLITCNELLRKASSEYYTKLRLTYPVLSGRPVTEFYTFYDLLSKIDALLSNRFLSKSLEQMNKLSDYIYDNSDDKRGEVLKNGGFEKSNEVKFITFLSTFYPRYADSLKKAYSPDLVWTEIQSSIKGSSKVLHSVNGRISKEAYVKASSRVTILTSDDRAYIYEMFEEYERFKYSRAMWDLSDFTFHIYSELAKGNASFKIDYIYIDEVQDLTQMQISLFKFLSDNLNGFCFGGDTAQTIASGVGFRFQDLSKLFYEHFLDRRTKPPAISYLTQNFRTHSGILEISNSVLSILFEKFPNHVDKIPAENCALFLGETPVYITQSHGELSGKFFGSDVDTLSEIEMGAQQVNVSLNVVYYCAKPRS